MTTPTLTPEVITSLVQATDALNALASLLNGLNTQVTQDTETCGYPTLEGTPCKFSATTNGRCGKHTPDKVAKRDARVAQAEQDKAAYLAQRESKPRLSPEQRKDPKHNPNRRAAALCRALGYSASGPEWKYLRDGIVAGKDEDLMIATLKGAQ